MPRRKLWAFRLLTLFLAPIVFGGLLEGVLALAGYGYPTAFLLQRRQSGAAVLVPNNQFGWRFFGREVARWPCAFAIPQIKATNVVRIFVLGESAARGEPQPDFGLPRVLEALLSLRYPGVRFEVVNTAMTAINSHAILPIARDCSRAQGDIWVIYMGNNEVVGPFGAGTVFGAQTPPLPLIRASLAAKATRTGQLLDAALGKLGSTSEDAVWGGMTMFLEQQVRADDPRLVGVYHHFARNLADIIQAGHRSGAGVVVSTVAVNLRDSAPFASSHRADLSVADRQRWEEAYRAGITALLSGNPAQAAKHFQEAASLDDTFAELRFRQGACALALGDFAEARRHYQAACDFDTLRFRCDTTLNDLIRRATTNQAQSRILLADGERAFAVQSSDGLPGEELFYEHVHLTFPGNYLLARTIADQVVKLLPDWAAEHSHTNAPWPSAVECERRLGYSAWHEAAALNSIISTLSDPPFTGQLDHEARLRKLESQLATLASGLTGPGIVAAMEATESTFAVNPEDPVLCRQLTSLKRAHGDLDGALAAAQRAVAILPNDAEAWTLLGSVLARQQKLEDAASAFRQAFQFGPQGIKSRLELAAALATLGKYDEAIAECHSILTQKPRCVPALLQLGQLHEKRGRKSDAAACFRQAFTNRSQRLPELIELAGFFQTRSDFELAALTYQDAVRLSPNESHLQLGAGRNFASLGRYQEAERYTAEAVRITPEAVEPRLLHGIVLFKQGRTPQALEQFHAALRLQPESVDARLNLGIALAQSGKAAEALRWFDEALARSPTNQLALQYVRSLRGQGGSPP